MSLISSAQSRKHFPRCDSTKVVLTTDLSAVSNQTTDWSSSRFTLPYLRNWSSPRAQRGIALCASERQT
jgi:hypothetical protein